jgi:hypothetical protein
MSSGKLVRKCLTLDRRGEIFAPMKADGETFNPDDEVNCEKYMSDIFDDTRLWLLHMLDWIDFCLRNLPGNQIVVAQRSGRRADGLPEGAVKLVRPQLLAKMFSIDLDHCWRRDIWQTVLGNVLPSNAVLCKVLDGWKVERQQHGPFFVKMDSSQVAPLRSEGIQEYQIIADWIDVQDRVRHRGSAGYHSQKDFRLRFFPKALSRINYWFDILETLTQVRPNELQVNEDQDNTTGSGSKDGRTEDDGDVSSEEEWYDSVSVQSIDVSAVTEATEQESAATRTINPPDGFGDYVML